MRTSSTDNIDQLVTWVKNKADSITNELARSEPDMEKVETMALEFETMLTGRSQIDLIRIMYHALISE